MEDFHLGRKLGPGMYSWREEFHVDEREFIIETGSDPNDPRDVEAARNTIAAAARELGIPVEMRDA